MATAAQILNLANGSGNNEYNLGVGFDSGHTDITPSSLYGGWSDSYYFFPKPDNSAVVFRMKVTGGRTSANTKYPRCELREMAALTNTGANDPKAAWNGGSGTHWMRGKTKITHVPNMKPWICFAQIHNGGSDVIRLQTEGTSPSALKLVARHTPPGGSEVVTTIQSSYTVGQVIDWKIECINGTIKVYLGGVVKYTGNGNYTGCYFKAGLYLQSSVNNVNNTEGGDTSQYGELELYDFMTWHTGQPNPAATYYEVNGGGGGGSNVPTSVNAGTDSTINVGTTFSRTASEAGTATITSRKWTVQAAPAGAGAGSGSTFVPEGQTTKFTEDFTVGGTTPFSNWTSVQNKFVDSTSASSYNPSGRYSQTIVDGGSGHTTALRTEVRDGDTAVGTHERAELSSFGKAWNDDLNEEVWYKFSVKFGEPTFSPTYSGGTNDWIIFFQVHAETADGAPPLALAVRSDGKVYIQLEPDDVVQTRIQCWTVVPGQWEDIVLHVKWSPNSSTGFVHMYRNGTEIVPKTFRQTSYTSDFNNQYLKLGVYRRDTVNGTIVVFHDGLRISTTPVQTAPGSGGSTIDNTQAAHRNGWGDPNSTWSDNFNYGSTGSPAVPNSSKWSLYQGVGHDGNGTRDAARCRVDGSKLVIEGLASGSTGGMSHKFDQQYGKWECRARSYATAASNGNDYHPVLIIWPTSDNWPEDGEYDFSENGVPGDNKYQAYIHFPHDADVPVQQRQFTKTGVDLTLWHNFAIEWTLNYIRGYFDGEMVFETSGGANADRRDIQTMPSGHLTIQLDNFDGTSQTPAKFEVDWVNVYPLVPVGAGAGGGGTSIVGTEIGTAAALSWLPPAKGAYTLRYTVTTAQGTFFDDVVVNVVESGGTGGTPTSSTLGKTTAPASFSASSTVKSAVSKHTATATGVIKTGHAHAWMTAGSTATKMIVHADNAGAPGAKLCESDLKTLTNTTDVLQDYTFSGANQGAVTTGVDYWIGLAWNDPGTDSLNMGRDSTAGMRQENQGWTWPTIPDPFGTPTAQSGPVAAWVDVESAPVGDTYSAPTFVGMTSDNDTSSSLVLTPPAGLASGDHQLLVVDLATANETFPNTPAGFVLAQKVSYASVNDGGDTWQAAYYVSNSSTVTGDITIPKGGTRLMQAHRLAWRGGPGFDLDTDVIRQATDGTTISLPDMFGQTGDLIVSGAMNDRGGTTTTTFSTPSGWTERVNASSSSTFPDRLNIGVWEKARAADGTQTGSFTISPSDDPAVFSIRLRRVVTAGTGGGGATPGAAPEFVAVGSSKSGSSATITMDGIGATSGQFDVIAILSAGGETMTSVPAGWELLDTIQGAGPTGAGGGPYTGWLYYNTGGAGSASFTKSGTRFWHAVRGVWKGQNGLGAHQVRAEASGSGGLSHALPPVFTVNPNSRVVGICMQDLQLVDPGPYESPPTWSERYDVTKTAVDEREAIAIADVLVTTPAQVTGSFGSSAADEAILFAFVLEAPPPTGGGGTSGTKLEAAQAILARLDDPLAAGDFFEDWSYTGMPAVVGEWNDSLLADYVAATGPYEFPGDIDSGQVQAWLRAYIDAQTGGGGEDPGPEGAPTISAGADGTIAVNVDFFRVATEDDNGAAITSRAWTILSGPAQVGATMSTTDTVTWQFTVPGIYVVAYQATNSLGTAVDTATITVTSAGAGPGHWPKTSGWFTLQR